ncbi:Serine/arginine repetitive matrix protein 1 [Rhizophlyctis rosea]|nr:Serine/arginine repetitive matrix protein 1 [Rhizophlyctis rosea]
MGDAGFFKGTSADQDTRFGNKEKKLLKSMTFPAAFSTKVDIKKVNLTVIKPWITEKVVQLMGFEDEVFIDYVFSLLEEPKLDPRTMQINISGFLEYPKAPQFMEELWNLLVSAQDSIGGIPKAFLDKKKEEIRQKRRKKAHEANENPRTVHDGIMIGHALAGLVRGRGLEAGRAPRTDIVGDVATQKMTIIRHDVKSTVTVEGGGAMSIDQNVVGMSGGPLTVDGMSVMVAPGTVTHENQSGGKRGMAGTIGGGEVTNGGSMGIDGGTTANHVKGGSQERLKSKKSRRRTTGIPKRTQPDGSDPTAHQATFFVPAPSP